MAKARLLEPKPGGLNRPYTFKVLSGVTSKINKVTVVNLPRHLVIISLLLHTMQILIPLVFVYLLVLERLLAHMFVLPLVLSPVVVVLINQS